MHTLDIVKRYYEAFNRKDYADMLSCVHADIRHEPNQGDPRIGKEKFAEFVQGMEAAYDETLKDMVFFTEPGGNRIAVEFVVHGIYKQGEVGLPPAHGQSYVLPAAAFLEVRDGRIARITTYYNLPLWIALVSDPA